MKANEIEKGGKYIAKVSGNLTTVRVDEIREVIKRGWNSYAAAPTYRDAVVYDVTNLTTGRRTTFKSAAKFRRPVNQKPAVKAAVEQILGKELADGVTPMPETLAQKIRDEINEQFKESELFPADFEDDPHADDHGIPEADHGTWAKNQGF